MTQMTINESVIQMCDKGRLFDLMVFHGLPISQAIVYHFCIDKDWRNCDVAHALGVSKTAIADAKSKASKKMKE